VGWTAQSRVIAALRYRFEPLQTTEQAAGALWPARRHPSRAPSIYIWLMPRHVRWHWVRVGLVVALIVIFAGVVIDSLFSASWALDDGVS
jgi:hypothetical protein